MILPHNPSFSCFAAAVQSFPRCILFSSIVPLSVKKEKNGHKGPRASNTGGHQRPSQLPKKQTNQTMASGDLREGGRRLEMLNGESGEGVAPRVKPPLSSPLLWEGPHCLRQQEGSQGRSAGPLSSCRCDRRMSD